MKTTFDLEAYEEAAISIRTRTQHRPHVGLVLGSGLSPLAEQIRAADRLPYAEIPHFPVSTVEGHAGQLVLGELAGLPVCAMQGRFHYYEGYTLQQTTFPIRVMSRLGIETLILTNAAGGINKAFRAGDLMLIEDHINFLGMMGQNPLRGPNQPEFGIRFPPMNETYTPRLRHLARTVARELDLTLQRGVYAVVAGPNFETPAEVRFLRTAGADAVGMSTVPEALVAHHAGMAVLGISSITNIAIDRLDSRAETSHDDVLATGKSVVPRLTQLLNGIMMRL